MFKDNLTLQDYINADYETLVNTPLERLEKYKEKNLTNNFSKEKFITQYVETKEGLFKNVPFGVKDMVSMENYKVTLGSKLFIDNVTKKDAEVISNLKIEGFNVFSALSMHELAYGITGDRSNTGPIKNYNDDSLMAGGSSSGSAVAVALGVVPLAVGTDTSGSIRGPAAFNDVVGFKPAYNVVSIEGVYPLSKTLDHIGPITNNVTDSYISYLLMKGQRINKDNLQIPQRDIQHKQILVPKIKGMFEFEEGILDNFEKVINLFKKLDMGVKEVELPHFEKIIEYQKIILKYEAYQLYKYKITEDIDEEVVERIKFGKEVAHSEYQEALNQRSRLTSEYISLIKDSVLVLPTMLIYPKKLQERTVKIGRYSHLRDCMFNLTAPFNYLKLPVLSMPVNFSKEDHYNSIQLIGCTDNEVLLFQLGYLLEQKLENTYRVTWRQ